MQKRAKAFTVGSPSNPGSNMAALNSKEHLAKVKSYIELANKEGATIHCGMEYNGGPNPELITPQEANVRREIFSGKKAPLCLTCCLFF